MCGRYASFLPAEALARLFGTVNPLPNLEPTWNMAPTRDAPVVRLSKDGERHLDALKWGLIPYFTKDLKKARKPINARSETTSPNPACSRRPSRSAAAWSRRRSTTNGVTIPRARRRSPWRAWTATPSPSRGIWETWKSPEGERLQTFATITTDANSCWRRIQDRMPVIIERADWPLWLGELDGDPARTAAARRRRRAAVLAGR